MAARAIDAGRAAIRLSINDAGFLAGLRSAERSLKAFAGSIRNIGQRLTVVGAQLTGIGVAASAGAGLALRTFASLDDQLQTVRALTGATSDEFQRLGEQAKELGRTTSFTASEVAGAQVELGRAGFGVQPILDTTRAVLSLARATGTELPRSAEIAGSALRAFNLDTADSGRVADVLAATANKSAQTLEDLFEALKPVAPIAAQAGESLEETAAAIGTLANNGIRGSLAGNALARAYKNLADEASPARDRLAQLGVAAVTTDGQLRAPAAILADLADSLKDAGEAARLASFETIFGRGQAAALVLAQNVDTTFSTLREELLTLDGFAQNTAEQIDSGIGGAFRRTASAVEGVGIAFGESLAPITSSLSSLFQELLGNVTEFISSNRALAVQIGLAAAGVTAFGVALTGAGVAVVGLSAVVSALGTVVGALGAIGLTPVVVTLGTLGAISVAAATDLGVFRGGIETVREELAGLAQNSLNAATRAFGALSQSLVAGDLDRALKLVRLSFRATLQAIELDARDTWARITNEWIRRFAENWLIPRDQAAALRAILAIDDLAPAQNAEQREALQSTLDEIERVSQELDALQRKSADATAESARQAENAAASLAPTPPEALEIPEVIAEETQAKIREVLSGIQGTIRSGIVGAIGLDRRAAIQSDTLARRTAKGVEDIVDRVEDTNEILRNGGGLLAV